MININEYIENSKKNKVNSLDITNHIENVVKNFDVDKVVKEAVDKVFKEKNLIFDKIDNLLTKIENQNEKIHKLAKAGTLNLNDVYEYEKLIKEMDKLDKDNEFEPFLDNHKKNLYNIIQERDKDTINNIENFLQYLNKEEVINSARNVDLNNTEPVKNLNDRIKQVEESLENLSSDNKEIYTNKVLNAVREFNKEILNKKEQEVNHEQEVNYDFER